MSLFKPRAYTWSDNGIGFLRLILASMVLLGHATTLGGFESLGFPLLGPRAGFGMVAVMGFFTLSGILITRSWESSKGPRDYFVKRILRIFPGYWVCLLMCGLVFGPLAWHRIHGSLDQYPWTGPDSGLGYFLKNFTSKMDQDHIHGLYLMANGKEQGVNFPLWTIISEFSCYVLTGILGMLKIGRQWRLGFLCAMLALAGFIFFKEFRAGFPLGADHTRPPHLLSYLIGVCIYYYHEKVPLIPAAGWAAAIGAVASSYSPWTAWLFPFFFGYAVVVLGFCGPIRNIERKADLSYGVYMYGWPMQLLLPLFGLNQWGIWPYLGLTVLAVLPVAAASWYLVEKPATRLKKLFA